MALTSPCGQGSPSVPIGSLCIDRLAVPFHSCPVGRPRASTGPTSPGLGFGPDPLGGTLTSPLCLHPPTQGPPAPHTKPRLSLAHPRDLPAPCQEPPALGRCELLPEPQVTAAPQEGVKRGLRVFLSEEKGPLAPVCLCSCFPFPAQRAPHSCFWSPPARSLLLGNGFQPRRGIRGLDRRQHSRPRGGVTPHGARLRPTRPPRPSSDAWASSHEPLLRLLHCAVEA